MEIDSFIKSFKNWFQIFSAFVVAIILLSMSYGVFFLYMEDEPEPPIDSFINYYPDWTPIPLNPGTIIVDYDSPPDLGITVNELQGNLTYFLIVNHVDEDSTVDGNLYIIRTPINNDTVFLSLQSDSEKIEVLLLVIPNQTGEVISFPMSVHQFVVIDIYHNYEF